MSPLLVRVLHRFRPREGWLPLALALMAVLCAPATWLGNRDNINAEQLVLLALLAAVIGLRFARSRISAHSTALWASLLGIGLVLVIVGRLLPPLSLIWHTISYAFAWLRQWPSAARGLALPFSALLAFVWQRLSEVGARLWWWWQSVTSGGVAEDRIALMLVAALLTWLIAFFCIWQIYRRRAPLLGLLPVGAAVAVGAFFRGGSALIYLMAYLFSTLWLAAAGHLWKHRETWEQRGIDHPDDLGLELVLALTPAIAIILILAAVFPVVHPRQIRDAFWRVADDPWSKAEQLSERLFGPMRLAVVGPVGTEGTLPSAHLLGGSPELAETVVFYVATDDPPPPVADPDQANTPQLEVPRRYWRTLTYDTYTGRGWLNGPLEEQTLPAGQTLDPSLPAGDELRQRFDLVDPLLELLPAVNAPLKVDQVVQNWWRAPGDLAKLTGSSKRYVMISRPPRPTVSELRAASAVVPTDIAERYLILPEGIPQRVLALAERIAAGAETPYDRAYAIEVFMRGYTYTLDIPEPPPHRDLVDYFLFDLQEGYCDYYASAMVVMARATGVPARLATGYAQGAYDHDAKRWVVAKKDGHSWVEVYFDGIGWVEFEPTAGFAALDRPGSDASEPAVPEVPPRVRRSLQLPGALAALIGVIAALLVAIWWMWRPRSYTIDSSAELIRDLHSRMLKWGSRLGLPLRDGQTANEYSEALCSALQRRGEDGHWLQVQQSGREAPAAVEYLTDLYVRTQYSPNPITPAETEKSRGVWTRLRRRLWWLWLAR